MVLYAWYSKSQFDVVKNILKQNESLHRKHITNTYKTYDNKEIIVTMVSSTKDHKTKFEDILYLGEVEKWSKAGPHYIDS